MQATLFSGRMRKGLLFLRKEVAEHYADCRHAHANPECERIERAGKSVIALTGLSGCLIEIKHNSDAGHEEEEEHHPELLDAAHRMHTVVVKRLIEQANQPQYKGQHIEYVVSLVTLAELIREGRLVAQTGVVNKGYA